jgi:aminotransferase
MMENKLAKVVKNTEPSPIRVMFAAAEDYDNVISLGIGEPDFNTPVKVCEAALKDAIAGHTHYTSSPGYLELRQALADYLKPRYQNPCIGSDNIVVTVGGMGSLVGFFKAVCDPGDEIIVPEPYFPAYKAMIIFSGGSMVNVRTRFEEGFVVRPEEIEKAITPRTKAILLNSPNNPTGAVIPGKVLDEIAELAIRHDLLVLSDEVYDQMVFDGKEHESIYTRPGMAERTMVIGSFSKSFAMTGWRMGWIFGPKELAKGLLKVTTFYTSCPPSVSQRAALAALKQPKGVWQEMMAAFERRRNTAYDALTSIEGIRVHRPQGSFYIFPSVAGLTDDPMQFSLDLLDKEQVVVVPGEGFGPSGKSCIRLACTVNDSDLAIAMEKFTRFCKSIRS